MNFLQFLNYLFRKKCTLVTDKLPASAFLDKHERAISQEVPYGNHPIALKKDIIIRFELIPDDEEIAGIMLRLGTYCRFNTCHVTVKINNFTHRFSTSQLIDNEYVNIPFIVPYACTVGEPVTIDLLSEDAEENNVIAVWCSRKLPEFTNTIATQPLHFPDSIPPRVSIVIPVFNKVLYTYNCLLTVQKCDFQISKELIIINNASSDETANVLENITGACQVIVNLENQGFVQACRQGAEKARGEFILFLNNDTQVTEGWLSSLITVMDNDPTVGVVGSKLIYPNGKLQEAGGIIFNDASGWNYGRLQDPTYPQFDRSRIVDYCSGASLMIRTSLWEQLGGFDLRFMPAYYEDTDLCFAARQAGYKVIYCHTSEVVHHEGITAGTDTASGYKAYQVVNHKKFQEKWLSVLQEHYPPPPHSSPDKAAQRLMPDQQGD